MKLKLNMVLIAILVFTLCFSSVFTHAEEIPAETPEAVTESETLTEDVSAEQETEGEDALAEITEPEAEEETAEEQESEAETEEETSVSEEETVQETAEQTAEEETTGEQDAETETSVSEEETEQETAEEETEEKEETDDTDLELTDKEPKNGLAEVDGQWGWYADDKLQENMTGLVNGYMDGVYNWYYVDKGVYTEATGIAKRADGSSPRWYYVENGKFIRRTGLVPKASGEGNWYYVENGILKRTNGITKRADGSTGDWYYVQNGVFTKANGIAQRIDGKSNYWYYVENGILTRSTGICRKADLSNSRWYYVLNGRYKNITGFASKADGSDDGIYYVQSGKFYSATGIIKGTIDGVTAWYYFKNGVFTKASGITLKADHSTDTTYYFVRNGVYRRSTGLAKRADGRNNNQWLVISGRLNRNYYGGLLRDNVLYQITAGKATVNSKYTGIVWDGTDYYYYANGSRTSASGIIKGTVNNKLGWWYVEKGKVDFNKNGSYTSGIRTYTISDGRAVNCNYYFFDTEIDLPSGGYNVSTNNIGIKVVKINQKVLGVTSAYYTYDTASAVMSYQNYYGLPATGVVDLRTWLKMGFSEYDWYNLGTYTTPVKTNGFSTVAQLRNAMINTAYEYAAAGTYYAAGASGAPGTYVDCSGLIYQCLYSIGINPDTNIVLHAQAQYEYTSAYLAVDGKLGQVVSTNSLQVGDLLFYANAGGSTVVHVAIYAGNGMIYDSWPGLGVTYRSMYIGGYSIIRAIRPV